MKRIIYSNIILILIISLLVGCQTNAQKEYTRYSGVFFETFDTVTQVIGYTETEEEFNSYFKDIESRFHELHKFYDIYNDYQGINNIKTINDNAGVEPVKVEEEIIELILFSKEVYKITDGKTNIAMGPVLKIWHDYRDKAESDPRAAELPPMEKLEEANKYTDINKVIVDTENSTVYLEDENMRLDVGAVAKGLAVEKVAKEIKEEGFTSGIISGGGNVRVLDKPLDNTRDKWGIGLQDPDKSVLPGEDRNYDVVYVNDASVVTSGDYQRFYVVDGERIHHIIDPETLMPGEYYRAVTIVAEDSGLADVVSTAAFLKPYDESQTFINSLDGVEALWIMYDGTIEATDGMKEIMSSNGAGGNI